MRVVIAGAFVVAASLSAGAGSPPPLAQAARRPSSTRWSSSSTRRRSRERRFRRTNRASCSRPTRPASGTPTPCRSPAARGRKSQIPRPTPPTPFPTSRHDDRILLTRDQGGNELNHLYVRTPDGEERDLTPGEKLKAQFAGWAPDGTAFYVTSNERDPKYFDIYRYDAKTYDRTLLLREQGRLLPRRVSDDGQWVALAKANTTNDSDMYLWNAATKKAVEDLRRTRARRTSSRPLSIPRRSISTTSATRAASSQRCAATRFDGPARRRLKADWDVVYTEFSRQRAAIARPS